MLLPVAILTSIFFYIDVSIFLENLRNINLYFFIPALLYFLIYPIVGIERWRLMVNTEYDLDFKTALKIYFIGETLNLILPSKSGDISKAYFLKKFKGYSISYAASTVVLEKILDLVSISIIFMVGFSLVKSSLYFLDIIYGFIILVSLLFLLFVFFDKITFIKTVIYKINKKILIDIYKDIIRFLKNIRTNKLLMLGIILLSLIFWVGHLFQMYLFFHAANVELLFSEVIFYMPVVIIVSLIPITVGGLGTRDVTLLFLLGATYSAEGVVLAGMLISLRYFIPGIIGMFFIKNYSKYVSEVKNKDD